MADTLFALMMYFVEMHYFPKTVPICHGHFLEIDWALWATEMKQKLTMHNSAIYKESNEV